MLHRVMRPASACAVALALSGCQFGSDIDRINHALPPGAGFLTAKDELFVAAKAQGLDVAALSAELDERMRQRASGCAGDFKPGPFDNDEAIREKLADKECFAKADADLIEWLGLRRVAIALDAPPLRPVPRTLATIETNSSARNLVFAQRAGVAISFRSSGTQVFDIGSGEVIARHERMASGALSANGRVYATQEDSALQLRDVESDALLLALHGAKGQGFCFLGDAGALVPVKDEEGKRRIEYFDFRSGRRTPVAIDGTLGENVVALPGDGTRLLASSSGQLVELQLTGGPKDGRVEVRRKWPAAANLSWGRLVLTADGKSLPTVGNSRIDVLDLSSMTTRAIVLSPLRPHEVAPTPDPDKLVVTVSAPGTYRTQSYLYSLAARTLAPIDATRAWGRITWLPALGRNAMVDNARLVPLDAIPVGPAEDANIVIERAMLAAADGATARQMRAASTLDDPTIALRREAIERTIRESNASPAEAAKLRQWAADIEARSSSRNAAVPAPRANAGGILRVPADADVRAVGVYEAADGSHGVGKARKAGSVRVFVSRSKRPIVLVLSSYEPVNWIVQLHDGAKVSNILLSSYHGSQAFGAVGARIESIGTQHAYKRGSSDFEALDAQVERFTGKRIGSFQGAYSGTSFSLGY